MSCFFKAFCLVFFPLSIFSQTNYTSNNIFQLDYFIENNGQFDYQQKSTEKILYSSEMGFGNLNFHKNGFSIHQRKSKPRKIHEALEYNFNLAELREKSIQLEWIGSDPNCEIIKEHKSNHYFSFGPEEYKSYGYKKLTYKNIYPHVDIIYTIADNQKFHYSIILRKGAKVTDLKMRYHNVKAHLLAGEKGIELQGIIFPIYEFGLKCNRLNQSNDSLPCTYSLTENEITFHLEGVQKVTEDLEIDPWVSNVTTLTGAGQTSQVGFDVDYDLQGNLYVYGGGADVGTPANSIKTKIACYNNSGALLWTFNCEIPSISWNYQLPNNSVSNFIVDKNTSKIYTGEGFNFNSSRIIRLKNTGIYDTFISVPNSQFQECWEFQFNCNTGGIIAMGGSTNSNLNLGEINKVNRDLAAKNITNIDSFYQDIVSSCLDKNGNAYVILASNASQFVNNRIYKVNSGLNGHVWSSSSGFNSFVEAQNKFFFSNVSSNGFNALSSNFAYLFYYDGKNLKAFDLANGNQVGNPAMIASYFIKEQGGIESDDCNNVYLGGSNGNILVYHFDGSNFNYKRQIFFNNHVGKSVHDLKANKGENKLYVSGAGFVAETYFTQCDSALFAVDLNSSCSNSAVVNLVNFVSGAKFSYEWIDTLTNTTMRSKLNSNQSSDTLVSAGGKIVKLIVSRLSDCSPAKVIKFVSFKPDTFIHPKSVFKCQGEFYKIGTKTYTTSGIYLDTLLLNGCPRIVQTNLTFLPASLDSALKFLCPGENFGVRGQKITQSGIYLDTMVNRFGCDSIMKYTITVTNSSVATKNIFDTICYASKRFFNNQFLDSSGTYRDTLLNQYGCDSVRVLLNLVVNKKNEVNITASICQDQAYLFNQQFLKSPGVYRDTLKDRRNCDSFITLTLSVDSFLYKSITANICAPTTYIFKGQNLSNSGIYYDTIQNMGSCDSLIILSLSVGIPSFSNLIDTICANQSYFFNQQNLKITGIYYDTFINNAGCDSIVTLNLKVNDTFRRTLNASICEGEQFRLGNNVFQNAGNYTVVLKSSQNCDSIINLNLVVNKKYFYSQSESICSGKSFYFYGQDYKASGVYRKIFTTIYGCDSIYELRLVVTEKFGITNFMMCQGDSLKIKNRYVTTAGDYYDTFKLPSGCDSFHISRVAISTWTSQRSDTVLCIGDSFLYKNKIYRSQIIIRDTIFSEYKTTCHQFYFIYLDFISCDTLNECQRILIPTGFSPNQDGINDKLVPIVKSEKIEILNFDIYNRWGQQVYNYFEDKNGWNGFYQQSESATGVYNFNLKYKCKDKLYVKSGMITLIR